MRRAVRRVGAPKVGHRDDAHTPELFHWNKTRERMEDLLRDYYRACTSQELPSQLLAVLKKLDEDRPELSGEHVQIIRETKD